MRKKMEGAELALALEHLRPVPETTAEKEKPEVWTEEEIQELKRETERIAKMIGWGDWLDPSNAPKTKEEKNL